MGYKGGVQNPSEENCDTIYSSVELGKIMMRKSDGNVG